MIQFLLRWVPAPLLVAGGFIIFYEGLPLGQARDVPVLGYVLGGLVDGRVDRVAFQAAESAREGLVDAAELAAAEAQRDAERDLRVLAEQRASGFQEAARLLSSQISADLEAERANTNDLIEDLLASAPSNLACVLSADLFERLRNR
ncbi:MAG: hypothetical protein AAGG69_00575 [Pseudomonadota bacterium]